jgi:hypothetical protein
MAFGNTENPQSSHGDGFSKRSIGADMTRGSCSVGGSFIVGV